MTTIFLGNGINRINSSFSWSDLLDALIRESGIPENAPLKGIPFPLLYESILFQGNIDAADLSAADGRLRSRVAEMCLRLSSNDLTEAVLSCGCEDIITTNYDYVLESGQEKAVKKSSDPEVSPEIDYRIHTYNLLSNRRIWHIHGESGFPRTMVLGHDMYARNISKMSAYVEKRGYDRLFAQSPSSRETICWMDLLFNSDVHIVGFGLDYSEIDVWWAMNLRARLLKDLRLTGRVSRENRVFYHARSGSLSESFLMLLTGYFIEPVIDDVSLDYASHYRRALEKIREDATFK